MEAERTGRNTRATFVRVGRAFLPGRIAAGTSLDFEVDDLRAGLDLDS